MAPNFERGVHAVHHHRGALLGQLTQQSRPATREPAATRLDRIYDGYPDVALDLIRSRTFDERIQLVEHAPRVLDGPPDQSSGC